MPAKLDMTQLDALFRWMAQRFPPSTDPEMYGAVTPRMEISIWRGKLIEAIARQADRVAADVLAGLARDLPEYEWLPLARQQADEERRRSEWTPPTPRQVVELGGTEGARYLADSAALQSLVLEVLSEIQGEMRAHLPLAHYFWNTDPPRAKSENEMSNVLARELRSALAERGVVVNREVQVNPAPGGAAGQRTDLHIQAIEDGREPLLVVVEVKGAWNAKLDTAMEGQLLGEYLAHESGACGVYLVAWCRAEDWDTSVPKEETRCRSASARSLDETREFFATQADELATGLVSLASSYGVRVP